MHLFKAKIEKTNNFESNTACLTCNKSDDCSFYTAEFSKNGLYYIEKCAGPGIPHFSLKSTVDNRSKCSY